MVLNSFVRSQFGLRPVTVEVVLTPGVGQIQILGLPDQLIKESSQRILSALRHQGFRMPPAKKAIVNLQPNDLKKSSQGLDLAIALGILLESEQLDIPQFDKKNDFCYGSLTLKGEVVVPNDLQLLNYEDFSPVVLTGESCLQWRFPLLSLKELSATSDIHRKEEEKEIFQYQTQDLPEGIEFEETLARLMMIVATGEHSLLVAGYAGAGKTTLVEHLVYMLRKPDEKSYLESKKYWRFAGRELNTRPVVQPHHSITPIAMIGGGSPPRFGEISLAHGGALILDELLEFHPLVQSALREPMEKGVVNVARVGGRQSFPADTLILATTNLCPCGQFQPEQPYSCRCSSLRLRQYLERLTGPFLDRFCIFYLFRKSEGPLISLEKIRDEVRRAQEFSHRQGFQTINNKLSEKELINQLDSLIDPQMIPKTQSRRRFLSLLRVARSIADLAESPKIQQSHLEEAQIWTSRDQYLIHNFRMENFAAR